MVSSATCGKLSNDTQHTNQMSKWQRKGKAVGTPTTHASSAAARSSRPGDASRAPRDKGGKN